MKTPSRSLLLHAFAWALIISTGLAQQQNSPGATLTLDNQNGPAWPIIYNLSAASFAPIHLLRLETSGAPNSLFTVVIAPAGLDVPGYPVPGVGILNLNVQGVTALVDGFGLLIDPSLSLGGTAITDPTGHRVINLGFFPAWAGHSVATQALVADPASPTLLTLSSATLLNVTP